MRALADRIRGGGRGIRLRPTKPGTDLGSTALAIDEMLEALEAAEADARAAELRMRALLADVSHDLRTPIAGVIAAAEQLLRDDPSRAQRERRLVGVIQEGRRAARLVDDLMLMARLDAGAGAGLIARPVDVVAVTAAAVDVARQGQHDRFVRLRVDADGPLFVAIDPDQLVRLLTNLIDNARQATMPGGQVEVAVSAQAATASLTVTDDGPGVPPGERERIFDRLVRLDPARRAGGSGLGLPIARALARQAGGDVRYVPNIETGACFEVVLPLVARDATPEPAGELVSAH
jgi:signal transduction histidine kinase